MILRTTFYALAALAMVAPACAEPLDIAVFDIELVNTSTGLPPTDAEQARLAMLSQRLRDALDASPTFDVVDIAPVAEKAANSNMQACGGCDRAYAKEIGADLAMTGVIHKMSELILNISFAVRDVESGNIVGGFNADIRSNTDESWTRGLDWLLEHRILAGGAQQ
jgi:hypothetical protein